MSIILRRRHSLLHVRALLAKRNGGEEEICPLHHGLPLDSQLLHQERATPRAPLREEATGSRVLHRELAPEEMQEETVLGYSRPVRPRPRIVDVPAPQIQEQFVNVPVPQIMEETVEAAKSIPQERIQQRTLKETVNVPALQIQEQIVAVVKALF